MSGILSTEQIGQMGLLRAMVDPDAKAHVAEMIENLLSAQKQAESALVAGREQEQKNRALVAEANEKFAAAEKMVGEVEARAKALDDHETRLREVNEALAAEKAKFEDVRNQVKAGHADRDAELDQREAQIEQDRGLLTAVQRDALEAARGNVAEEQRLDALRDALYAAIAEIQAGAKTISAAIAKIG